VRVVVWAGEVVVGGCRVWGLGREEKEKCWKRLKRANRIFEFPQWFLSSPPPHPTHDHHPSVILRLGLRLGLHPCRPERFPGCAKSLGGAGGCQSES